MQTEARRSLLVFWSTAILVFFISLIRVYDIRLDKIEPYSTYTIFIPMIVVPAYIYCFIRSRKGSLRAQLVLLNFLFFFIYLSFLNIIGGIYTETTGPAFDVLTFIHFLLNITLLVLAFNALKGVLGVIDIPNIKERFTKRPPRELTALFFFLAALVVSGNFWMEFIYLYSSHKLDCTICLAGTAFLFPFYLFFLYIAVAVLLIGNRPLGYALGPGLLLFCGVGGFQILDLTFVYFRHLGYVLSDFIYKDIWTKFYVFKDLLTLLPFVVAIALELSFLKSMITRKLSEKES